MAVYLVILQKGFRCRHKLLQIMKQGMQRFLNLQVAAYPQCRLAKEFIFIHDSKKAEKGGSRLALRLVSTLKDYGLVNHGIWVKMNGK